MFKLAPLPLFALIACVTLLPLAAPAAPEAPEAPAEIYELRTYTTNEGKLDDLHARFRDHTVTLFKKHGMESVGYWVPADEPASENTLIYVSGTRAARPPPHPGRHSSPIRSGKKPSKNPGSTARSSPNDPTPCSWTSPTSAPIL